MKIQLKYYHRYLIVLFVFFPIYNNSYAQNAQIKIKVSPRKDYIKRWNEYGISIQIFKSGQNRFDEALSYKEILTSPKIFLFDSIENCLVDIVIKGDSQPDTTIEGVLLTFGNMNEVNIVYPPFCLYDKHRNNKTCPSCNKKDKVLPIHYGEPISSDPKSSWSLAHYLGGCRMTGCDPSWFCQRDSLKF